MTRNEQFDLLIKTMIELCVTEGDGNLEGLKVNRAALKAEILNFNKAVVIDYMKWARSRIFMQARQSLIYDKVYEAYLQEDVPLEQNQWHPLYYFLTPERPKHEKDNDMV